MERIDDKSQVAGHECEEKQDTRFICRGVTKLGEIKGNATDGATNKTGGTPLAALTRKGRVNPRGTAATFARALGRKETEHVVPFTHAAIVVGSQSFTDPKVVVMVVVSALVGLLILMPLSRRPAAVLTNDWTSGDSTKEIDAGDLDDGLPLLFQA